MIYTLAHIGYLSLFIGLLPLLVIVTLGFRYTVLIEDRVATERGGISTARNIWQAWVIIPVLLMYLAVITTLITDLVIQSVYYLRKEWQECPARDMRTKILKRRWPTRNGMANGVEDHEPRIRLHA